MVAKIMNTLYLPTRAAWRKWLKDNHKTEKEVWLIFYKAKSGRPNIPYDDAVEEALCFGWIDSIIKKLDEERYARKFTPRTNINKWSELNKRRARKMIAARKMTKAGLAKIPGLSLNEKSVASNQKPKNELPCPSYIKKEFMAEKKVWENFCNLAPSYKRMYILWIDNAKGEDTRARRIEESIRLLRQNKKLGLK
jgi:uncharacterized protein YdeI (YjbR/CyaY-like superfamily)